MADWPANGDTDWNTKMLAYLAIGHDTDGTHKKSQMLTDMEWSPTTVTGGATAAFDTDTASHSQTIVYPNGMIQLIGYVKDPSDFVLDISAAGFTAIYKTSAEPLDLVSAAAARYMYVYAVSTTAITYGSGVAAANYSGYFYEVWGR